MLEVNFIWLVLIKLETDFLELHSDVLTKNIKVRLEIRRETYSLNLGLQYPQNV